MLLEVRVTQYERIKRVTHYTIEVRCGTRRWSISKTFEDFQLLHKQMCLISKLASSFEQFPVKPRLSLPQTTTAVLNRRRESFDRYMQLVCDTSRNNPLPHVLTSFIQLSDEVLISQTDSTQTGTVEGNSSQASVSSPLSDGGPSSPVVALGVERSAEEPLHPPSSPVTNFPIPSISTSISPPTSPPISPNFSSPVASPRKNNPKLIDWLQSNGYEVDNPVWDIVCEECYSLEDLFALKPEDLTHSPMKAAAKRVLFEKLSSSTNTDESSPNTNPGENLPLPVQVQSSSMSSLKKSQSSESVSSPVSPSNQSFDTPMSSPQPTSAVTSSLPSSPHAISNVHPSPVPPPIAPKVEVQEAEMTINHPHCLVEEDSKMMSLNDTYDSLEKKEDKLDSVDIVLRVAETALGVVSKFPIFGPICEVLKDTLGNIREVSGKVADLLSAARQACTVLQYLEILSKEVDKMQASDRELLGRKMKPLIDCLNELLLFVRNLKDAGFFTKMFQLWKSLKNIIALEGEIDFILKDIQETFKLLRLAEMTELLVSIDKKMTSDNSYPMQREMNRRVQVELDRNAAITTEEEALVAIANDYTACKSIADIGGVSLDVFQAEMASLKGDLSKLKSSIQEANEMTKELLHRQKGSDCYFLSVCLLPDIIVSGYLDHAHIRGQQLMSLKQNFEDAQEALVSNNQYPVIIGDIRTESLDKDIKKNGSLCVVFATVGFGFTLKNHQKQATTSEENEGNDTDKSENQDQVADRQFLSEDALVEYLNDMKEVPQMICLFSKYGAKKMANKLRKSVNTSVIAIKASLVGGEDYLFKVIIPTLSGGCMNSDFSNNAIVQLLEKERTQARKRQSIVWAPLPIESSSAALDTLLSPLEFSSFVPNSSRKKIDVRIADLPVATNLFNISNMDEIGESTCPLISELHELMQYENLYPDLKNKATRRIDKGIETYFKAIERGGKQASMDEDCLLPRIHIKIQDTLLDSDDDSESDEGDEEGEGTKSEKEEENMDDVKTLCLICRATALDVCRSYLTSSNSIFDAVFHFNGGEDKQIQMKLVEQITSTFAASSSSSSSILFWFDISESNVKKGKDDDDQYIDWISSLIDSFQATFLLTSSFECIKRAKKIGETLECSSVLLKEASLFENTTKGMSSASILHEEIKLWAEEEEEEEEEEGDKQQGKSIAEITEKQLKKKIDIRSLWNSSDVFDCIQESLPKHLVLAALLDEDDDATLARINVKNVGALHNLRDMVLSGGLQTLLTSKLQSKMSIENQDRETSGGGDQKTSSKIVVKTDKTQFAEMYERSILELDALTPHQQGALKQCIGEPLVHVLAPAGAGKTFLGLHLMILELKGSDKARIVFSTNSPALAYFVGKWCCKRLKVRGAKAETLLKRIHFLCQPPLDRRNKEDIEKQPLLLHELQLDEDQLSMVPVLTKTKKKKSRTKYAMIVIDEAHHVFVEKQARKCVLEIDASKWVCLSDLSQANQSLKSQSSLTKDDSSTIDFATGGGTVVEYIKGMKEVVLSEVVRSSQRIVAGAMAFQLEQNAVEVTCHHKSAGPPLCSHIFDLKHSPESITVKNDVNGFSKQEIYEQYTQQLVQAMKVDIFNEYEGLNIHNRVAIILPNETFRDEIKPYLRKAFAKHFKANNLKLMKAVDASRMLSDSNIEDFDHQDDNDPDDSTIAPQWILFDIIENVDGLERLIVIAMDLDTCITQKALEGRSKLYRAMTRAHMLVIVVNVLVQGGWFEFLTRLKPAKSEKQFDHAAAKAKLNTKAAQLHMTESQEIDFHDNDVDVSENFEDDNGDMSENEQEEIVEIHETEEPVQQNEVIIEALLPLSDNIELPSPPTDLPLSIDLVHMSSSHSPQEAELLEVNNQLAVDTSAPMIEHEENQTSLPINDEAGDDIVQVGRDKDEKYEDTDDNKDVVDDDESTNVFQEPLIEQDIWNNSNNTTKGSTGKLLHQPIMTDVFDEEADDVIDDAGQKEKDLHGSGESLDEEKSRIEKTEEQIDQLILMVEDISKTTGTKIELPTRESNSPNNVLSNTERIQQNEQTILSLLDIVDKFNKSTGVVPSRLNMWASIRDRIFKGGAPEAKTLNLTIYDASYFDSATNTKLIMDTFIEIRNITTRQIQKTETIEKSYKPKFNQSYTFHTKQNSNDMIMMKIMEVDKEGNSSVFGSVALPLDSKHTVGTHIPMPIFDEGLNMKGVVRVAAKWGEPHPRRIKVEVFEVSNLPESISRLHNFVITNATSRSKQIVDADEQAFVVNGKAGFNGQYSYALALEELSDMFYFQLYALAKDETTIESDKTEIRVLENGEPNDQFIEVKIGDITAKVHIKTSVIVAQNEKSDTEKAELKDSSSSNASASLASNDADKSKDGGSDIVASDACSNEQRIEKSDGNLQELKEKIEKIKKNIGVKAPSRSQMADSTPRVRRLQEPVHHQVEKSTFLTLKVHDASFFDSERKMKIPLEAYIEIRNLTTGQVEKTNTCRNSFKPRINERFVFKTKSSNDLISMKIMEVYRDSRESQFGTVTIPLDSKHTDSSRIRMPILSDSLGMMGHVRIEAGWGDLCSRRIKVEVFEVSELPETISKLKSFSVTNVTSGSSQTVASLSEMLEENTYLNDVVKGVGNFHGEYSDDLALRELSDLYYLQLELVGNDESSIESEKTKFKMSRNGDQIIEVKIGDTIAKVNIYTTTIGDVVPTRPQSSRSGTRAHSSRAVPRPAQTVKNDSSSAAEAPSAADTPSRLNMWANIRDRIFKGGAPEAKSLKLTLYDASFFDSARNMKISMDAYIEIRNITTGQVEKTVTCKNSYKPKFNEHFLFKTKQNANDMIMMKIMEVDKEGNSSIFGSVALPLDSKHTVGTHIPMPIFDESLNMKGVVRVAASWIITYPRKIKVELLSIQTSPEQDDILNVACKIKNVSGTSQVSGRYAVGADGVAEVKDVLLELSMVDESDKLSIQTLLFKKNEVDEPVALDQVEIQMPGKDMASPNAKEETIVFANDGAPVKVTIRACWKD